MAKMEPAIRDAFIAAIKAARNSVKFGDLVEALEIQNIERAVRLLRIEQGVLFPLDDAIRAAYVAGGVSVAAPTGISGAFGFDGRHPRAEAWAAQQGSTLIQGIQQDTLATARGVISEGLVEGRSSRKIALDLVGRKVGKIREGGFIGLDDRQAASIRKGRAALLSGDPSEMAQYLTLKQRDKRFDGTIRKAIKAGEPVSKVDVDSIMAAHRSKALKVRGRRIARNEAHTATAAGRDEAYAQILDRDDVAGVSVRWQHNLSANPREDHLTMDGTVIQVGETFDFGGVQMKHPHDPAGGADHSIGCRCTAIYRVILERD